MKKGEDVNAIDQMGEGRDMFASTMAVIVRDLHVFHRYSIINPALHAKITGACPKQSVYVSNAPALADAENANDGFNLVSHV